MASVEEKGYLRRARSRGGRVENGPSRFPHGHARRILVTCAERFFSVLHLFMPLAHLHEIPFFVFSTGDAGLIVGLSQTGPRRREKHAVRRKKSGSNTAFETLAFGFVVKFLWKEKLPPKQQRLAVYSRRWVRVRVYTGRGASGPGPLRPTGCSTLVQSTCS